jgi:hypothetical protein
MLKFVELWSEIQIASFLAGLDDPHNHTLPVNDVVLLPDDQGSRIMVTPRMCAVGTLPFNTVSEVFEFMRQFFEVGLLLSSNRFTYRSRV